MNWSAGKISTIYQKPAQANGLSTPSIGCVLHLPGLPGGGSKIYDRSPYGNIGTITGAVWKRSPGGLWVLDFDGTDDYIELASDNTTASPLNFTSGNFSILMWVNFTSVAGTQMLFCRGLLFTDGYYLMLDGGKLYLQTQLDGDRDITSSAGTGEMATDEWMLLGASRSGTAVTLTKNGVDINDVEGVHADPITCARSAKLGIHDDKSQYDFYGKLALPRVHNRALSALEIQNHFNREKHLFGVW